LITLRRLASCALALTLAAAPGRAEVPRLSRALPGSLHVGALVDLQDFLAAFPELGSQGFISEQLDLLAERGVPDPREHLETLALGSQLGKPDGVTEGVALGTSEMLVVPAIRELAEQEGIDLKESAYQGVTWVTGTYHEMTSRFGDITEDILAIAYDQAGAYQAADRCVDTVKGQHENFWDAHGVELSPGVYARVRAVLNSATRSAVADTPLTHLQHIVSAWIDLAQAGPKVKMKTLASGFLASTILDNWRHPKCGLKFPNPTWLFPTEN